MFTVVSVRAVPDYFRGYLSRFLSEADVGLYVGVISQRVADKLWDRCVAACTDGSVVMITSDNRAEQGFDIKSTGNESRAIVDSCGVLLSTMPEILGKEIPGKDR